ncbi:unnamed protein product [Effrenium voratum]|nr:unnamed protein product [Effrenium voratum]
MLWRSLVPRLRRVRHFSGALWHTQLLELLHQVPEELPAGKAASVLDSFRSLRQLEEQHLELQRQRDVEQQSEGEDLEELIHLYNSELQAVEARVHMRHDLLEKELFLFQRGEGRLEHHDAVADSRDAVMELAPGVGGQEAALFTAELMEMLALPGGVLDRRAIRKWSQLCCCTHIWWWR